MEKWLDKIVNNWLNSKFDAIQLSFHEKMTIFIHGQLEWLIQVIFVISVMYICFIGYKTMLFPDYEKDFPKLYAVFAIYISLRLLWRFAFNI